MSLTGIHEVALADLSFSETPAQVERRAHLDKTKLAELAASIKTHGLVQPILVRPVAGNGHFEVVAGERRAIAAKQAGLEVIAATVRELTDEQVYELQLIENLQRQDLHELAEAEGYEALARLGHSVDDMAAKVGKSKATVYARMKLLDLAPDARKAYYAGDLSASTALLVARIPDADQQIRALTTITERGWKDRTMTYREAADYVHENFMLKLSSAPFPRDDTDLVPSAGACGPCPLRTGNQPELFGDVKGADVCTSPACFQAKKAAHVKRELEKAKATGERVIRGGEAKRILPDSRPHWYDSDGAHRQLRNGYARPGDKCLYDPKKRTYAEIAGKDAPRVLLQNPETGRVEKVFEISAIADQLKAKGLTPPKPAKDNQEQREQDHAQRKQEDAIELASRRAVFQAILKAAPTKLAHADLAAIIAQNFRIGYGEDDEFYAALGWPAPKTSRGNSEGKFLERLLQCSEGELARIAVAITAIDAVTEVYGDTKHLDALAKRFKLDAKKLRAEAAAAIKPPAEAKAKKAPKGKKR